VGCEFDLYRSTAENSAPRNNSKLRFPLWNFPIFYLSERISRPRDSKAARIRREELIFNFPPPFYTPFLSRHVSFPRPGFGPRLHWLYQSTYTFFSRFRLHPSPRQSCRDSTAFSLGQTEFECFSLVHFVPLLYPERPKSWYHMCCTLTHLLSSFRLI